MTGRAIRIATQGLGRIRAGILAVGRLVLMRMVAEVLVDYPIAVVRGHGVYACAATLNLAYKWTCSLELSAKTAFIAQQAGKI